MRFMYLCPKCKSVYSAESATPEATRKCTNCDCLLMYLGYTKPDWELLDADAKKKVIADHLEEARTNVADPTIQNSVSIQDMAADVKSIKNMVTFFTVLTVLNLIGWFIIINKVSKFF